MTKPLFMFLAQGVATPATPYRAGARHALMLYGTGVDIASARASAIAGAADKGWDFVEVKREKKIDADPSVIEDDILRSAAVRALAVGCSLIVYADEIAPDG